MRLLAAFASALLLPADTRADEVDGWRKDLGEQVELRSPALMVVGISVASTGLVVGSTAIAAGAWKHAFGSEEDSCSGVGGFVISGSALAIGVGVSLAIVGGQRARPQTFGVRAESAGLRSRERGVRPLVVLTLASRGPPSCVGRSEARGGRPARRRRREHAAAPPQPPLAVAIGPPSPARASA